VLAAGLLLLRQRDPLAAGYLALLALSMAGVAAVYWNARVPIHGLLTQSAQRTVAAPIVLSVAAMPLLVSRIRSSGAATRLEG
jgi:hypothetical protein